MNSTRLLHKIGHFFMWNKLSSRLIALALVMTTLLGMLGVNIFNMEDTYASGPVGDVIFNYPYTHPTGSLTAEQVPWNMGWDSISNHKGFDRAYTGAASTDFENLTPKEIAIAMHPTGTSGYYNGFVTDEHVVINNGSVSFYGYQIPQYMDYVFTDQISAVKQISFSMNPLNMVFHTFYQSGLLFNGTISSTGRYTGYALILECGNTEGMLATGIATLNLYFLNNERMNTDEYNPGNITTSRTLITTIKTGIENYSTPSFGIDLQVDPVTRAFKLYVDGVESANVPAGGVRGTGMGVGFFTGYYGHNCPILSVVRYYDVAIDATFPPPVEQTATVKFMIEGTTTEIRIPETETGWPGQRYRVVQPQSIMYNGEIYVLRSNSISTSTTSDIEQTYFIRPNEIILYYFVPKLELGDPDMKNASVNGGMWTPGSEISPVEVNPGDEIEYRIWANGNHGPMMTSGNSNYENSTLWYGQPLESPMIEKQEIASIKFVSLSSNYPTPEDFMTGVGGVWEGKTIVKAWNATETNPANNPDPEQKVFAWLVASTTQPTRYDLYIGGLGGVYMSSNQVDSIAWQFAYFVNCTDIDLTNFYTETARNMSNMFYYCEKLTSLNLGTFDTSKVTNMQYMFYYCEKLTSLDLSTFDTSKVTNMQYMFYNCRRIPSSALNLSTFDTSKVTNMAGMFSFCIAFETLDPLSTFDTSKVTNMNSMFNNCGTQADLPADVIKPTPVFDVSTLDTSKVTNMASMFFNCRTLTSLDLSTFDTSNVTLMTSMFSNCQSLTSLDLSTFDTSKVTNMSYMFNNCLEFTSLDLNTFDTSKVTNMARMFYDCRGFTSLDLSTFNTSNVTNMESMFYNCRALTSLDLSSFDTPKVTNMLEMFLNCEKLVTLDLSSFDTSRLTTMAFMFRNCRELTSLDLSSFNTSNVTNMSGVFYDCRALTSLDLSSFNTSKVTIMTYVFFDCQSLTSLDLRTFNTSNVTNMQSMFFNCLALTSLNISSWNTAKVRDVRTMFNSNIALTTIYMETADFTTVTVASSVNMFSSSLNTLGSALTVYVGTPAMETWINSKKLSNQQVFINTTPIIPPTPNTPMPTPSTPTPSTPTPPTPFTPPATPATPTPVAPRTSISTITDVVPDGLTIIPSSITGTQSATPVSGTITWTLSGQTIVWTFYGIPTEVFFKVTVDAVTVPYKLYENYATSRYYGGVEKETNHTYHSSGTAFDINEQYYIFDGLLNNSALLQDNAFHGSAPNKVDPGENYDFDPAHAPSTMYGYSYYGYQYIDAVTDDPGSPQGAIHQGLPPATLFSNVQSDKVIRYYYQLNLITVTVYFVNESGTVIKTAVVTTQPAGSNYRMPPNYLDSFIHSSDTYNYYGYELTNTVGTAKTVGAQADKSILLSNPQFSNIQNNESITLYFTDTPTVTVNFVEYQNAFNSLKNSETYFVDTDKKFTPPAELTDDITKLDRLYEYVSYWSLDGGTTMNTGNPPVITGIDENKDLTLYFRTQYEIVEKFHPKDPTGSHDHGHGLEPYWTPLQPDITTPKYGGESFTGTPPDTITSGASTWNYIGYRVSADDTAAITYAYPPDPTIASVNDNVTFIYVYERAVAGNPTATKDAQKSTNGYSWSGVYTTGTASSPISVNTGEYIEYRIRVSGVSGTANLTVTDLLPEGMELHNGGDPYPYSGFSSTMVGNRVEVKWTGNYPVSVRDFLVVVKVTAASGLFINSAVVDTPAKKNILTNSTYHRTGFVLTEQFRELDDETNVLFPNRDITVPVGSAYMENPENLLSTGWTYAGWRLGSDPTVHPPGTPTPDTIISSVGGPDTITYLYKPTTPPPPTENILHIRQIVIDPVTGIEIPIMGYFELTGGGNILPLISESGVEGLYVTQFSDYKLVGDVAFNVYDLIPQYYEFAGHYKNTGTSPDAEHDDSDERILPAAVANGSIVLDYSSNGEYWLTVYTKPKGTPDDYEWDYATNDFGSINR